MSRPGSVRVSAEHRPGLFIAEGLADRALEARLAASALYAAIDGDCLDKAALTWLADRVERMTAAVAQQATEEGRAEV